MKESASIAKITAPSLPNVLPRERLFKLLDEGRKRQVVWISGPAGSGKTTLVGSYLDARKLPYIWYRLDEGDTDPATFFYYLSLSSKKSAHRVKKPLPLFTPEYLGGVGTFTRRFFENLCTRLKPPCVIVFDNYHHIPLGSPVHDVIREALSAMPTGISVIISSRADAPPVLALFSTYGKISSIGWEDLKFDRKETALLLNAGKKKKSSEDLLKRVHAMTTGWAAGLVLVTERLRTGSDAPARPDAFRPQQFFDYFATELFEKTDRDTQLFLLKTSCLPEITSRTAAGLTGNDKAGSLLANLNRNHFFTEQRLFPEPVYHYHPLFRDFLKNRAAETLRKDVLSEVRRKAGELLEASGRIEEAAECYRASTEWGKLGNLISANAASLVSQGRHRSLEEQLKSVPAQVLKDDPRLLYWKGVCIMPSNPSEGHAHFERALALFRRINDAAGVFRAWSGAIEALVQEMGDIKRLDKWVALVFEMMKKYAFPSPEIADEVTARIFTAMPWDTSDANFIRWRKRAMELIDTDGEPNLRLMTAFYLLAHHIWIGDYSTGRRTLDVIRRLAKTYEDISPLASCMGLMCEGWFVWMAGDLDLGNSILQDALAKANESGVHIWDRNVMGHGVALKLCAGDLSEASRLLTQMGAGLEGSRLFDRFYYHLNSAWLSFMASDLAAALAHQQRAEELGGKTGFAINGSESVFGMVLILTETGEYRKARGYADRLHRLEDQMGSALVTYQAGIADAIIAFREGRNEAGYGSLRGALRLGRERGFVYFKWWVPAIMTGLFVKALEAGIETEYVKRLIRTCKLVPDEPPLHIKEWPWPVRIFTLGDFKLLIGDKPVLFSGKVQKRPLEMLKALISLGGDGIREDQLHDALWSDAEGDAAGTAFRTTLHRLRQLIGSEKAITVREGRVSLDQRYCWVDAWAFERLVRDAETARTKEGEKRRSPSGSTAARSWPHSLHMALSLYGGHFLETDDDKPWTTSTRERMRNKFLRAVKAQGDHWLWEARSPKKGDGRKAALKRAVECYERGLEVDDVAEEFYQDLMRCHQQAGSRAEALKVYRRCRASLSNAFGIEPSEETESIYKRIRGR